MITCSVIIITALLLNASAGFEVHRFELWDQWKTIHGKSYSVDEEMGRLDAWRKNHFVVAKHNAEADSGMHSYKIEMNMFGDTTETRTNPASLDPTFSSACNKTKIQNSGFLPDSVDWRKSGAVSPVQNQGQLGQSWCFSATGALESQILIKNGHLVKLSEQNLVDCATATFSPYCEAESPDCAFYYVFKNDGIDTEDGYPNHQDGHCHFDPSSVGATCKGCYSLSYGEETELQRAVAHAGPIAVFINAGLTTFQLYDSGIYDDAKCDSQSLDHTALVVGYGSEHGKDFWIVKNSWGTSWGEDGYIRIARNNGNVCGIASRPSYPVV